MNSISYRSQVDIIIVNWNAGSQLDQCLASIECHCTEDVRQVVVVDNGSIDGSVENCIELYDLPLKVIWNRTNLGFAKACNQGAQLCKARYFLFLNPDTRLFAGCVSKPLEFMDLQENRDVGICGIQLLTERGSVARNCSRFPSISRFSAQALGLDRLPGLATVGMAMREWDHSCTRSVEQIMGAFFMVRRELFESLGGFDERFFVYFEEVDFSFRARKRGYKSMYLVEAQAYHAGGGTSCQVKATRLFYSLHSRLLYGFKHFPALQAWALAGVTTIVEPLSRCLFCVLKQDWPGIKNTVYGYLRFWCSLREIISSYR